MRRKGWDVDVLEGSETGAGTGVDESESESPASGVAGVKVIVMADGGGVDVRERGSRPEFTS